MPKKITECKKCGKGGLVWAQSKTGKWYLTDQEATAIRGDSGRVIKTIRPAHRCPTEEQKAEQEREDAMWARHAELSVQGHDYAEAWRLVRIEFGLPV